MDLPDDAQALLGLPPSRFAAGRDALAARLSAAGDPAAKAVRKLRRPVGLAWVLNRLARERAREVEALLASGDEVRAGTRRAVSGAGAGALRDAEQALRDRARRLRLDAERLLAEEGRPPSAAALARVELLLRVAAVGDARETLRAGALMREPEVGGEDLSGFTVFAGGKAGAARAPSPRPAPPARAGGARGKVTAAAAKASREARAREERETRARRKAIAAARAEARRADERAAREARRAEDAERRAREVRERAAAAKAEADRLRAKALELQRGP